jgi:hypothetical protein
VDFRPLTLDEVLDAIGAPQPSSGAGVAAALSLALAVACAQKAVGITAKRREDAELSASAARLQTLRELALEHARHEATLFAAWLRDQQARDAALLVKAAEQFQGLSRKLGAELDALDGAVLESVSGDISAARALQQASAQIEADILRDNRRERARATS